MNGDEVRAEAPDPGRPEECLLRDVGGHSVTGHDIVPRNGGTRRPLERTASTASDDRTAPTVPDERAAPTAPTPSASGEWAAPAAPTAPTVSDERVTSTAPTAPAVAGASASGEWAASAAASAPAAPTVSGERAAPAASASGKWAAPVVPDGWGAAAASPAAGGFGAAGGGFAGADLEWERALELIHAAGEVCLACHVAPDGDALGSMLALAQALRGLGKRCLASFGEPFAVPAILRFLPGQELLVEPARMPARPELMISLDAAGRARLGALADAADNAGALIVVDHHASNTGFGGVRLVDPDAAATAVLVEELIRRLGVPLDRDIAQGLYAGLASDTGSFKYPCTTPEVHDLAGRLLTAGVRPEAVSRELWDRAPFGYLQVLAGALARARLERDAAGGRGLVWTTIARADRRGVPYDQLEGIIDQLRRTDEAEVAVVCKETDDGRWYFSARSKGGVDLSVVCAALDGGGHREMAGFLWTGTVDDALDRLRALLPSDPA